jgi:hypothetical protein
LLGQDLHAHSRGLCLGLRCTRCFVRCSEAGSPGPLGLCAFSIFRKRKGAQDYILGNSQPSLRDCSDCLRSYPGLTSWATFSRPFGAHWFLLIGAAGVRKSKSHLLGQDLQVTRGLCLGLRRTRCFVQCSEAGNQGPLGHCDFLIFVSDKGPTTISWGILSRPLRQAQGRPFGTAQIASLTPRTDVCG